MFSTMKIAPSTRMPKSTAPIDSRLADAFFRSSSRNAHSRASGMVTATIRPGAHVVQEEHQHRDHERQAHGEVAHDDVLGLLDQRGEIVEGMDLHVLRQDPPVELPRLRLDPLQHVLGLAARQRQDHALDGVVARPCSRIRRGAARCRSSPGRHPSPVSACRRAPRARCCRCPAGSGCGPGRARSRTDPPGSRSRRRRCCCWRRWRPAPASTVRPRAAIFSGSSSTWYCMSPPPNAESSATPGTARYCGPTTQSSMVFSSIGERSELSST